MLQITIHPTTPANMLRAIRAACNELLGDARPYSAEDVAKVFGVSADGLRSRAIDGVELVYTEGKGNETPLGQTQAQGSPVAADQFYRVGEQPSEQTVLAAAFDKAVQTVGPEIVAATLSTETDSTGAEWNPELHASTKSKNADGTWKKRRGAAQAATEEKFEGTVARVAEIVNNAGIVHADAPPAPPLPPAAPTAPAEPIMPKIFALITSQIVTINQAVAAAQAEGFADLGANGLGGAPVEKQLAVLRKLEGQ